VRKIAGKWKASGCDALEKRLTSSAQEVLDQLPLQKRTKSGWRDLNFDYITASVDARNEAAREHACTKTPEAKGLLQEARRELKKRKKVAKNKWFLHVLRDSNDSTLPGGKDRKDSCAIWTMATKLKRGAKKWKPWLRRNIVDEAGIPAKDPAGNAANYAAFYTDLFTNDVTPNGPATTLCSQMQQAVTDRVWLPPTMAEMRKAAKFLCATAPGMSGMPAPAWQAMCGNADLEKAMLEVMIRCWVDKKVPTDWTKFCMITLEKKGNLSLSSNYRGMSISETFSKVYASTLKVRLQDLHETIAPELSGGFRQGRGRGDCVCTAKSTLRQRKKHGLDSHVIAWDICKCFDKIPREFIWASMRKMGVDEGMISAVASTLVDTACVFLHVEGVQETVFGECLIAQISLLRRKSVGAYGECSQDLLKLVDDTAAAQGVKDWRRMGCKNAVEAAGVLAEATRTNISLAALRSHARLLLDRIDLYMNAGSTAALQCRSAASVKWEDLRWTACLRHGPIAHVSGRS
jgi:hypothetical protein